ncbi:MAG: sce7726 family protein [Hyphomicrobiales bacterium]|nr:sce7726 family protein [Hyphomicrobiales bacterium]
MPRRGPMSHSTDAEIRGALHRKVLRAFHRCNDTLVIDELGIAHAKARIDVAVVNGCVHGFEIKSAADTLTRLPQQLELYEECLEKLTIVCADKHIAGVRELAPIWCGIVKVTKGPRGGITFITVREPKRNPNIQAYRLAHLLWRSEAVAILSQADASPKVLRAPRKTLYKSLAAKFSVAEITAFIKQSMALRQDWRPHQSPA